MTRIILALLVTASVAVVRAEQPAPAGDVTARVEYTLNTARTRDPVLGGPRDRTFVSVWLPAGVKMVRGGICNPFSKGDDVSRHWQATCRQWQFAYVQVDFDAVKKEEFTLLATGLADLAKKTGHPELEYLPLCFIGMSRGGGMSMQLAELMPERTIACVPVCLEVGPASDAARRIPVLTIFGEKDGSQTEKLLAKLPAERKLGARFGIAVQWNRRHEFALANNLSFVFFDEVISRRLPKRPVADHPTPLADIPLEDGWLGDPGTWSKDGKTPTIAAWKDYKGERNVACWFPSQRVAAVWQAFVGASKDVTIAEPPGLGDGQPFVLHSGKKPIVVKLTFSKNLTPAKATLWDCHQKLAEKTAGPWEFTTTLRPGIHSFIVTVEDSAGRLSSRPHSIVVGE